MFLSFVVVPFGGRELLVDSLQNSHGGFGRMEVPGAGHIASAGSHFPIQHQIESQTVVYFILAA